ncbi:MAG: hypothetical protein AB1599_02265 [Planctomycetota bacterium]
MKAIKYMKTLWNKEQEIDFFKSSLKITTPEKLFYLLDDKRHIAYWPKGYKGKKSTLQSRNAFIGDYTEKWCSELLVDFAEKVNAHIVQDVICEELELTKKSPADAALCKTKDTIQKPSNILLIFEVKMSVVWNWELKKEGLVCIGDYSTHKGTPGLLRSDTMLKAIGKSINVRISNYNAAKIPIIVIGNTPIKKSYHEKVDHLKKCGIIQGFWSVNPKPLDSKETLKNTKELGFCRFDSYDKLEVELDKLLKEDREFFSSMQSKGELGRIIEIANKEASYEKKAEKFLELIRK